MTDRIRNTKTLIADVGSQKNGHIKVGQSTNAS